MPDGTVPASNPKDARGVLRRLQPLLAFLGGFLWDVLTIGRRVDTLALWRLGAFLAAAGVLAVWLARRLERGAAPPEAGAGSPGRFPALLWRAPYLLLQFFFGGIFSALFILYFKSAGHFATWLTAALLGALLVGNEFAREHYGRRITLIWGLFALNAVLLFNFALPQLLGSPDPRLFYASTAAGVALAHGLWLLSPRRASSIAPAWCLGGLLILAWRFDMIAPVPLVQRDAAVGHAFARERGGFALQVEPAPRWRFWRGQSDTVHMAPGERLYGVSAVFAPPGMTAPLEHRWETLEDAGWRVVHRTPFTTEGGREGGFRGYSWITEPRPGEWRLVVATRDGRTIGALPFRVEKGGVAAGSLRTRVF